jgi:hypothetical protein
MDALQDDLQELNAQLLLIASDPESGEQALKLLDANAAVTQRITQAGPNGIGTAIRCCAPLITFHPFAEEMLAVDPREWRSSTAPTIPDSLQELSLFALRLAQRVALSQPTVAELHFNLSRVATEGLGRLALKHFKPLSRRYGLLLRLRKPQQAQIWERLLIGDSCPGPLGYRIAQQTALLTLGGA